MSSENADKSRHRRVDPAPVELRSLRIPPTFRTLLRVMPGVLAAAALGVGVYGTPFQHGPRALAFFAALYLGLFVLVWEGVRLLGRGGLPGVLAGGVCIGSLFALQLRWDAELLNGRIPLVSAVLAIALVVVLLLKAAGFPGTERVRPLRPALLSLFGGGAMFALLLALGFFGPRTLRWHLLNHHRLAGHGAYALFSDPIRVERDRLWSERPRLVSPWERAATVVERPATGGPGTPNIVFLLVDTLRADALAAWGGDPAVMPFTNAWAEESVVLGDVTANASWTRASVASIFTGLLPEEHGAVRYHDRLSQDWNTMAEVLSTAGFHTAAFVSNWVQVGVETGFDQGFDTFIELKGDATLTARAQYARAEALNAQVLAWVEREQADGREEPFFLYLHYLDPHSPYLAGAEPGLEGGPREQKAGAYRQELAYFDGELERFVERLEGLMDGPTVFLLTSDHGEEFWEHGEWGHGHSLYSELIEVPALVHLPDGASAGVIDARLELRDLFQLVIDLARPAALDVADWAHRHSRGTRYASQYLDRVADVRPDKKRTALRSIEEDGVELIWSGYGASWQLFDRELDPATLVNRVDRDDGEFERLRAALEQAVLFWVRPPKVERSAEAIEFLQDLGYAGGVREGDTQ